MSWEAGKLRSWEVGKMGSRKLGRWEVEMVLPISKLKPPKSIPYAVCLKSYAFNLLPLSFFLYPLTFSTQNT
jgi:hypothetical protein